MSPTITLEVLPPHRSAGRACILHPQGVTAVVHGWLFVHWATVWVKSNETPLPAHGEELRAHRNTPDVMLEHFITFHCNTSAAPKAGR